MYVLSSDLEHVSDDEVCVFWYIKCMFVQNLSGDPMTVEICPHWRSTMDTEKVERRIVRDLIVFLKGMKLVKLKIFWKKKKTNLWKQFNYKVKFTMVSFAC